jgi:CRISPR/Cas system Type II protein with McrA/HNH and RuvC-like nuclease domain
MNTEKLAQLRLASSYLDESMTLIYKSVRSRGIGYFRRAKKLGVKNHLNTLDILRLLNASRWECVYCGRKMIVSSTCSGGATFDHIIPFCRGGANMINNVVPCCRRCNESKGSKTLLNWIDEQELDLDCFAVRYGEMWSILRCYDNPVIVL